MRHIDLFFIQVKNTYSGNLQHLQPWRNVHRNQLLEKELSRIGETYLRDLSFVLATFALESVVPQIGNGNHATQVADMDAVGIRNLKQPFTKELCCSMRYLAI